MKSTSVSEKNEKNDVCQIVTDRIIEQLKQGIIPWQRPWTGCLDGAISYTTRKPYSLLNQLLLGKSGEYLSFKQISELGGKVKKGEKGSVITFWKRYIRTEKDEDTNEEKQHMSFCLRYYYVWHIDQTEGIKSKIETDAKTIFKPNEKAEEIINSYFEREKIGLNCETASNRAFYAPIQDSITVPNKKQYENSEEFYSTLFHEMTHSTGHWSRLNRFEKDDHVHFGSETYSKEELVAEIGAASLVNHCGLETEKSFRNSAAYVQGWLSELQSDKRFIISACSKATSAVRMILGLPTTFENESEK